VLQYACGAEDADEVEFSVVDSRGTEYRGGNLSYESWSSLGIKGDYLEMNPDVKVSKIKVKQRKIDTILNLHHPEVDKINLVSIDIEGWELEALSGFDFERYNPDVLIVENIFFYDSYRNFMKHRGYDLWKVIAPNEVYARRDYMAERGIKAHSLFNSITTAMFRARRYFGRLKRKLE